MNKREVLSATSFGQRIAEDELEHLAQYFVETEQWRKVASGEVDVVYGPKGAGKSALYALLRTQSEERLKRGVIVAPGENVRGTPVFETLITDPPTSEEQFRALWKFYFLSLIGTAFRIIKLENEPAKRVIDALEREGLVASDWSLRRMLRAALDYVRRIEGVTGGVKLNPTTGTPEGVEAKVTLREPAAEERNLGYVSADTLLETADKALADNEMKFWILLDRLDVAFADSADLEANALRALFRVYRDMAALSNFGVKIFLRVAECSSQRHPYQSVVSSPIEQLC